ncbi:MAG: hypothetical protein SW833_23035 [Cyanobacteriota bacterium]|nr:hypothetical protein [Cyanobacteriota bacterium]
MQELMTIFGISRKTLHNWFTRWEDRKMAGLYNQKGRGRKPEVLNDRNLLQKNAPNLVSWEREFQK